MVKQATKHVQLVLQHCCETIWIVMFTLPPTFGPVFATNKAASFFSWVVKPATLLSNFICSKVAKQVAHFLFLFYSTLTQTVNTNSLQSFSVEKTWYFPTRQKCMKALMSKNRMWGLFQSDSCFCFFQYFTLNFSAAANGVSKLSSVQIDFGDVMGIYGVNFSYNAQCLVAGCGNGAIQVI